MPTYINWVGEIQGRGKRRAALLATYPVFLALNVSLHALNWAFHVLLTVAILPLVLWRAPRVLNRSFSLRWYHAKPRGERDWVSDYMDKFAEPKP